MRHRPFILGLVLLVAFAADAVATPVEATFGGRKSSEWATLLRDGDETDRRAVVEKLRAVGWEAVGVLKEPGKRGREPHYRRGDRLGG